MKTFIMSMILSVSAFAVDHRATLTVIEGQWEIKSDSMTIEVSDSAITLHYPSIRNPVCLQSTNPDIEVKVSIDCNEDHLEIYFDSTRPYELESGRVYVLVNGEELEKGE